VTARCYPPNSIRTRLLAHLGLQIMRAALCGALQGDSYPGKLRWHGQLCQRGNLRLSALLVQNANVCLLFYWTVGSVVYMLASE